MEFERKMKKSDETKTDFEGIYKYMNKRYAKGCFYVFKVYVDGKNGRIKRKVIKSSCNYNKLVEFAKKWREEQKTSGKEEQKEIQEPQEEQKEIQEPQEEQQAKQTEIQEPQEEQKEKRFYEHNQGYLNIYKYYNKNYKQGFYYRFIDYIDGVQKTIKASINYNKLLEFAKKWNEDKTPEMKELTMIYKLQNKKCKQGFTYVLYANKKPIRSSTNYNKLVEYEKKWKEENSKIHKKIKYKQD